MRVYLASTYRDKELMKRFGAELEALGMIITHKWYDELHQPNVQLHEVSRALLNEYRRKDIYGIEECDIFVIFTVDPTEPIYRGGKHFEAGYAYAQGKPIIVVGPRENIFYYAGEDEEVYVVDTWEQAKELLVAKRAMLES